MATAIKLVHVRVGPHLTIGKYGLGPNSLGEMDEQEAKHLQSKGKLKIISSKQAQREEEAAIAKAKAAAVDPGEVAEVVEANLEDLKDKLQSKTKADIVLLVEQATNIDPAMEIIETTATKSNLIDQFAKLATESPMQDDLGNFFDEAFSEGAEGEEE